MKLLKTFIDPKYPESEYDLQTREAARVIVIDEIWLIPIVYVKNYDYYKIPGGGIDTWESQVEGAKREALEECGRDIEVLGEIGRIEERRGATTYNWTHNLLQISYWFYGKINRKWETDFTDSEIKEWFILLWLSYEEALNKFQNCSPQNSEWILINERDKILLVTWYNLLKNA